MDDQDRNVIDGSARARQWRRSRSKSDAGDRTNEARSEAPKSIASSLLVPADMVDGALEPASGGQVSEVGEPAPDVTVSKNGGLLLTDPPADSTSHHNLFLSPDAAVIDQRPPRSGGRSKAALLALLVIGAPGRASRLWVALLSRTPRPGTYFSRRARTAAVALCVVTVTVVVGAVIAAQPTHTGRRSRLDHTAASAAAFDRIKSVLLSSVASAIAADQTIRQAHSAHPVGRHRAIRRESRSRTPSSRTKVSPPATTNYTASSGRSTASTSVPSGDSGSASTAPSGATSSPAAQPASAGSGPTTAFGASGALGPGSSPNG